MHAARRHLAHPHARQAAHGGQDVALAVAGHALVVLVAAPGPALTRVVHRQHMPPAGGCTAAQGEQQARGTVCAMSPHNSTRTTPRQTEAWRQRTQWHNGMQTATCFDTLGLSTNWPCRCAPADGRLLNAHAFQAGHPGRPAVRLTMAAAQRASRIPALPQQAVRSLAFASMWACRTAMPSWQIKHAICPAPHPPGASLDARPPTQVMTLPSASMASVFLLAATSGVQLKSRPRKRVPSKASTTLGACRGWG